MAKVIEIQQTPNPNALKFVLERALFGQPMSFTSAEAAASNPLAAKLFAINGVRSVLLLGDFVTINKEERSKWAAIRPKAARVLENLSEG